jgi:hypothetical protein
MSDFPGTGLLEELTARFSLHSGIPITWQAWW